MLRLGSRWRRLAMLKAMREASSMALWTNSQPTPRLLVWPIRSPVMRWPILLELAELFCVDVDQFARPVALVPPRRFCRLQGT
jgi:hypothetical protein